MATLDATTVGNATPAFPVPSLENLRVWARALSGDPSGAVVTIDFGSDSGEGEPLWAASSTTIGGITAEASAVTDAVDIKAVPLVRARISTAASGAVIRLDFYAE